jgi:hypothetical protein
MNALLDKYHAMVAPYAIGPDGEQAGATYLANAAAFTNALPSLRTHVQNRRTLVTQFVP